MCPYQTCANNATCVEDLANNTYNCFCQPGFTGDHCEFGLYHLPLSLLVEKAVPSRSNNTRQSLNPLTPTVAIGYKAFCARPG